MSLYDGIRPGRVVVNGQELAGTVFQPPGGSHRTILDKTRVINYSSSSLYIIIGIIKSGQTKVLETLPVRLRAIAPHTTLIIDELRGEALDFPSEVYGDVLNAGGTPAQLGFVSISITGTQKRN